MPSAITVMAMTSHTSEPTADMLIATGIAHATGVRELHRSDGQVPYLEAREVPAQGREGYSTCMMTGAIATTVSPCSTRIVRTPWLARPTRRMSAAGTRWTLPELEIVNRS